MITGTDPAEAPSAAGPGPSWSGAADTTDSEVDTISSDDELLWRQPCVGEVAVTAKRFVCVNDESTGTDHAAARIWVKDLRTGNLRWVTKGVPEWAGGAVPEIVGAGDDWLMTAQVEEMERADESHGYQVTVQMYE
ncbi:MAG: hypothetical protein ACRDTU_17030 [Micromonosporaceae bacterium]